MTPRKKIAPSKPVKIGSYKVAVETGPAGPLKKVIGKGLGDFNTAQAGSYAYAQFVVGVRDAKGALRGGFLMEMLYETAFLKWAWVDEKLRGRSLGRTLMAVAEDESRRRGARNLWLDTFSYQARPFYEKLGYKLFGTLEYGRPELKRYWLAKEL
ncbi:MAG: GNAT family N-acetyltransferase [Micropepsaceae bacterium]